MTSQQDTVGITFANVVINHGIYNNVVNINLGVYNFELNEDTGKIDASLAISSRLRMDLGCAKRLRDALIDLLAPIEKQEAETRATLKKSSNGLDRSVTEETVN